MSREGVELTARFLEAAGYTFGGAHPLSRCWWSGDVEVAKEGADWTTDAHLGDVLRVVREADLRFALTWVPGGPYAASVELNQGEGPTAAEALMRAFIAAKGEPSE